MPQVNGRRKNPRQQRAVDMRAYYTNGANAVLLDQQSKERPRLKKSKEAKVFETEIKKSDRKMQIKLPKLRVIGLIFVLAMLVVAQYVAVQTMGYQVNEAQTSLTEVKEVNDRLKQEYAALGELSRIETLAKDKLGMVYPDKVIAYKPVLNNGKNTPT